MHKEELSMLKNLWCYIQRSDGTTIYTLTIYIHRWMAENVVVTLSPLDSLYNQMESVVSVGCSLGGEEKEYSYWSREMQLEN